MPLFQAPNLPDSILFLGISLIRYCHILACGWCLQSSRVCGIAGRASDIRSLLHEKETEHDTGAEEDSRPPEDPCPALPVGDETADDGGEVVGEEKEEGVVAHKVSAFVCEELFTKKVSKSFGQLCLGICPYEVCHHDFWDGLDWRAEEAP